jgi:23S rRNA pseudouridine1911/1915/1917 synthase
VDIIIEPRYDGTTIREFVKNELGLSRGILTRLKSINSGISLNGVSVTVRTVLNTGDMLTLNLEDNITDENEFIVPRSLPIDIIYEDSDIVAVNKSSAMPTHPSQGHSDDSLAKALVYYYKSKGVPFVFRAVNRLDSGTSGIVLVAKNRLAAYKLSRQLINGSVVKYYTAVVSGILPPDGGDIIGYIRRKNDSIILREVCSASGEGGAYARTVYTTLAVSDKYSIADVAPKTGRCHQIRVHFAHTGHPLVGDFLYGTENQEGMTHHALHARYLAFTQPSSGEHITLEAPPPSDISTLIEKILKYGNLYND